MCSFAADAWTAAQMAASGRDDGALEYSPVFLDAQVYDETV